MKIQLSGQGFTLATLFLVCLLGELDYQIIPPLLPLLAESLGTDTGFAGRAVPVYSTAAGVSSLLFGYLSDQIGRKPFIKYGLIGFSGASLLSYFVGSVDVFFLVRLLAGMTAGSMVTCATSYAADCFGYVSRGRAMAIVSSAYFAASILGVPLAAVAAENWGWRPIFLANFGAALGGITLVSLFLKAKEPVSSENDTSHQGLSLRQLRNALLAHMKRKATLVALCASLLSAGSIVGFTTFLGSHLNDYLDIPIQQVGVAFLWCGLGCLMGAPVSGILSDRWGKKSMLIVSGVALTICLTVIPSLRWDAWFFVALGLAGVATAFRMAPLLAIMTELVSSGERGTLLALRSTLSQFGIALSTFISSLCYSSAGYQTVGIFNAGLMGLSTLLIVFWVREPRQSLR